MRLPKNAAGECAGRGEHEGRTTNVRLLSMAHQPPKSTTHGA